jgi:hypothetical protein
MSALIKTFLLVFLFLAFFELLELLLGIKHSREDLTFAIAFIALVRTYDALEAGK